MYIYVTGFSFRKPQKWCLPSWKIPVDAHGHPSIYDSSLLLLTAAENSKKLKSINHKYTCKQYYHITLNYVLNMFFIFLRGFVTWQGSVKVWTFQPSYIHSPLINATMSNSNIKVLCHFPENKCQKWKMNLVVVRQHRLGIRQSLMCQAGSGFLAWSGDAGFDFGDLPN